MATSHALTSEEIDEYRQYPDSDGEPLAENRDQYKWIVRFAENLDFLRPNDFVGADQFWYPVRGRVDIRTAPDAFIAFGRPKWQRPSYLQWREDDVAPAVVVEVWSPSNTFVHQLKKLRWYEQYGVEEFWTFDPGRRTLAIFERRPGGGLEPVNVEGGWTSPRTGVHLVMRGDALLVTGPDGVPFRSGDEMRLLIAQREAGEVESRRQAAAARGEAKAARGEAKAARGEAKAAREEAAAAAERAEALAAALRAAGIDPSTV